MTPLLNSHVSIVNTRPPFSTSGLSFSFVKIVANEKDRRITTHTVSNIPAGYSAEPSKSYKDALIFHGSTRTLDPITDYPRGIANLCMAKLRDGVVIAAGGHSRKNVDWLDYSVTPEIWRALPHMSVNRNMPFCGAIESATGEREFVVGGKKLLGNLCNNSPARFS